MDLSDAIRDGEPKETGERDGEPNAWGRRIGEVLNCGAVGCTGAGIP